MSVPFPRTYVYPNDSRLRRFWMEQKAQNYGPVIIGGLITILVLLISMAVTGLIWGGRLDERVTLMQTIMLQQKQEQIDELKTRVQTLETWNQATREKLASKGILTDSNRR